MSKIELCGISKDYKKTRALNKVDLVIKDKEFLVIFGPAGAGKTTMLKIIAGVEMASEGVIKFNNKIVNSLEASERNTAMVFENYALYPHMTVYDNIAFPLRSKRYRETEEGIKKRIQKVTGLMHIDMLLDRFPYQLSNGQKQRVALGRCLVRNPDIFLLDEPLVHLDAKLRHAMRAELKEMQSVFSTTTLYVTHDYMEALSLGDRIAVINQGQIVQIGTGKQIYNAPVNEFVAKLVGEPEINLLPVTINTETNQNNISVLDTSISLPDTKQREMLQSSARTKADIGIRAQYVQYYFEPGKERIKGTIFSFEPIGNKANLFVDVKGVLIRIAAPNDLSVHLDSDIWISFNLRKALYFDSNEKYLIAHANQDEDNMEG